ncbi:hypothetical protein ACFQY5_20775 [Paeniroseomonas aquatica]|uniref:hypothetical protein n=1 Tax=Paeniroseomonas aquatica TaxID=373043 RepID=UPI003613631F
MPIFTSRIVEGNIATAAAQQGQADAIARAALLQARAESPAPGPASSRRGRC